MKETILNYVREMNHVTFAELGRHHPELLGEHSLFLPGHETIMLWTGWSEEAFKIVAQMLRGRELVMKPTYPMVYMMDGSVLNMPVATQIRKYKTTRWLPSILCTP